MINSYTWFKISKTIKRDHNSTNQRWTLLASCCINFLFPGMYKIYTYEYICILIHPYSTHLGVQRGAGEICAPVRAHVSAEVSYLGSSALHCPPVWVYQIQGSSARQQSSFISRKVSVFLLSAPHFHRAGTSSTSISLDEFCTNAREQRILAVQVLF